MLETLKLTLVGTVPLLMHNVRMADPLNPFAKALAEVSRKRGKVEADLIEMRWLEWIGSVYADEKGHVGLPAEVPFSCCAAGGARLKLKKKIRAAVVPEFEFFRLVYDGPKGLEALYRDGRFADVRPVRVRGARVMRCRPVFAKWSLPVSFIVDTDEIEIKQILQSLEIGGRAEGLGDYRPQNGRFQVEP